MMKKNKRKGESKKNGTEFLQYSNFEVIRYLSQFRIRAVYFSKWMKKTYNSVAVKNLGSEKNHSFSSSSCESGVLITADGEKSFSNHLKSYIKYCDQNSSKSKETTSDGVKNSESTERSIEKKKKQHKYYTEDHNFGSKHYYYFSDETMDDIVDTVLSEN